MADFNWDDTSRALIITNEDRTSLDAYLRFQTDAPCWHEDCRRPFKDAKLAPSDRDGLHNFSVRE